VALGEHAESEEVGVTRSQTAAAAACPHHMRGGGVDCGRISTRCFWDRQRGRATPSSPRRHWRGYTPHRSNPPACRLASDPSSMPNRGLTISQQVVLISSGSSASNASCSLALLLKWLGSITHVQYLHIYKRIIVWRWSGSTSLIYVDRWMVALPLITFISKDMALLLPISPKSQLNILVYPRAISLTSYRYSN